MQMLNCGVNEFSINKHVEHLKLFCVGYIRIHFEHYNINQYPNDIACVLFAKMVEKKSNAWQQIEYAASKHYLPHVYVKLVGNNDHQDCRIISCRFYNIPDQVPNTNGIHPTSLIAFLPCVNDIFMENNNNVKQRHQITLRMITNDCYQKNRFGNYYFEFGIIAQPRDGLFASRSVFEFYAHNSCLSNFMNHDSFKDAQSYFMSFECEIDTFAMKYNKFNCDTVDSTSEYLNMMHMNSNDCNSLKNDNKIAFTRKIYSCDFHKRHASPEPINRMYPRNNGFEICLYDSYYHCYNKLFHINENNPNYCQNRPQIDTISMLVSKIIDSQDKPQPNLYQLEFLINQQTIMDSKTEYAANDDVIRNGTITLDFDKYCYFYSLSSRVCNCHGAVGYDFEVEI